MDRVFLDANVLFSAAYREGSRLALLWSIPGVQLLTSTYAIAEARRHLDTVERLSRLDALLGNVEIIRLPLSAIVDWGHAGLPPKDVPIMEAAIVGRATHLLSGDKKDFGPLYGQRIDGVLVQQPGDYLRAKLGD